MNRTIAIYLSQDAIDWLDEVAGRNNRSRSYVLQALVDEKRRLRDGEA